jgi:hypothetical protein
MGQEQPIALYSQGLVDALPWVQAADADVPQGVRDECWLQGMMAGVPGCYFCIKAFSGTDLTVAIHETVPFAQAEDALAMVLTRHVRGKVILKIR